MSSHRSRVLIVAMFVASAATMASVGPANAVQRMYAGQLRMGFGDAGPTLDLLPGATMGTLEVPNPANNAIPACAAPGATITPSGFGSYPPATSMGAGPNSATLDFVGLAEVATTPRGGIDPAHPIQLLAPAITPAGENAWGLVTSCPAFISRSAGGLRFRRTRLAALSWPSTTASIGPGLGAVPPLTAGGSVSPPTVSLQRTPSTPALSILAIGPQRIGAIAGPQRFGGSVGVAGSAGTIVGFWTIPGLEILPGIGLLPIPIAVGRGGGNALTPSGLTGRVPTFVDAPTFQPFKLVTDWPVQRLPGGPLPAPTAADYPAPAYASAVGFAWTTGVVTAFDSIGVFRTTRTRSGAALDAVGPFSQATTAHLQLVSPSVVFRGLAYLAYFGHAITAEMEIRFIPEPRAIVLLTVGIGALVVLVRRGRV